MTASPPPPAPPSPPATPPPGGGRGALVAILGVVAVVGVVVAVVESRQPGPAPTPGPQPGTPAVTAGVAQKSGAFDTEARPEPVYAAMEREPRPAETPEVLWLDVAQPKAAHEVLRTNAWLERARREPVGQGFLAAWGGFFGTRGEDVGQAFSGAVVDLALDRLLATPYRVVWYGGDAARGAPAVVVPSPNAAATAAFEALVKVAGSGGFAPPACVVAGAPGDGGSTGGGGATAESIHRIVLADKIVFGAKLADRLVFAPRPQAVLLAMCKPLRPIAARPGVVVSLGVSLDDVGRGTQSVSALLGVEGLASLDFGVAADGFAPLGLSATPVGATRLEAAAPSPELLKAIPERSGVVLFLAVKLPKALTAMALRDTLASPDAKLEGRAAWPSEARQVAVVWNPRGAGPTELAVLWGTPGDEEAIAEAMKGGNGALTAGKACSVLAYATTSAMLEGLQAACAGKRPSLLQAARPVVTGLSAKSSLALSVNLGHIASQLTLDGWLSEHPAPNATTGPQELEAARRLLEELPTVGFKATLEADGTLKSGGFRS
ncbi:MAG: hypothetical protein INH41_05040 [Myxococcaceae bacterium]|nr:hypothetical protein [Myxococcaceae bacterium]